VAQGNPPPEQVTFTVSNSNALDWANAHTSSKSMLRTDIQDDVTLSSLKSFIDTETKNEIIPVYATPSQIEVLKSPTHVHWFVALKEVQ